MASGLEIQDWQCSRAMRDDHNILGRTELHPGDRAEDCQSLWVKSDVFIILGRAILHPEDNRSATRQYFDEINLEVPSRLFHGPVWELSTH
jgi:hypothetical protein